MTVLRAYDNDYSNVEIHYEEFKERLIEYLNDAMSCDDWLNGYDPEDYLEDHFGEIVDGMEIEAYKNQLEAEEGKAL